MQCLRGAVPVDPARARMMDGSRKTLAGSSVGILMSENVAIDDDARVEPHGALGRHE